jgi:transcriptional regulator with XRE-family HTH domain
MTFGERLARRRCKLTQKALAERLGVAPSEMHCLERGLVQDPHGSRVVALADALGVTTDYLLRGLGELPLHRHETPCFASGDADASRKDASL